MARESFVRKGLNKGFRADGRKLTQFRDIKVTPHIAGKAEGSCLITMGKTQIMVGIKMAVEKPYPDTPDQGNLMVNAELLPLSSPDFETGPPGIKAIEISRVIDRGIRESNAVDRKKLCITPGEKVWSVMIDICTLNADGNLLDAGALAALIALKTAKFPAYDPETGVIDYKKHTDESIPLGADPIMVTIHKIGPHLVVDLLPDEEKESEARLTVTSMEDGTICAMQKGGDTPLTMDEVSTMVDLALEKAKELRELVL